MRRKSAATFAKLEQEVRAEHAAFAAQRPDHLLLQVSLAEAELLVHKEPRFAPLVEHFGLIERQMESNLATAMISSLMSQQLSNKAWNSILSKLDPQLFVDYDLLEREARSNYELLEQLAAQSQAQAKAQAEQVSGSALEQALGTVTSKAAAAERSLPFSRTKLRALLELAAKLKMGLFSEEWARITPQDERHQALLSCRGIGEWTVSMLEIFYFGERDVLAINDYGTQKGWAYLTEQLELMDNKKKLLHELELFAQQLSPVGTAATFYLWAFNGGNGKIG